jgi:hypothetical protein
METIGDFINSYYRIYIDIFNKASYTDKLILITLRSTDTILSFIILFGFFAPRHLLIWHCLICFMVYYTLENTSIDLITNKTFDILKKNNTDDLSDEQLYNATKLLPIKLDTRKKILILVAIFSIIGYIYPEYSGNSLLKNLQKYLNSIDNESSNNSFDTKLQTLEINKLIEGDFDVAPILNLDSTIIDINNIDENLSVFNKIEPVKVEFFNKKDHIEQLNNLVDLNKLNTLPHHFVNKNKMMQSLKNFNDLI